MEISRAVFVQQRDENQARRHSAARQSYSKKGGTRVRKIAAEREVHRK